MKQKLTLLLLTVTTVLGFAPSQNVIHRKRIGVVAIDLGREVSLMAKGRRGGLDVGSSGGGKSKGIGGDGGGGEFFF
jgi:hypothetical protein